MEKKSCVCVTGAAGYVGSWLAKKLLDKGYTVHATLRNLEDPPKVGLLRGLPHADTRVVLFKADIYNPEEFEPAIRGCEFVFHVATPLHHSTDSTNFKDTTEAAVAGVKSIVGSCIRSGTVKKLIYTGTVLAASPLKEDGSGFRDFIDESCWTPLHIPLPNLDDFTKGYVFSKVLSEKEVLGYCGMEKGGMEVVSLACGLVGGDTLLPYLPASTGVMISQILGREAPYKQLKYLQEILGAVPIVHIDDVCEAHVFSMEQPLMCGRFLCACAYPTTGELANYFTRNHPEVEIPNEFAGEQQKGVICGSKKLTDMGFEYKYDMNKILDDSLECARRLGILK